jgi:hypothetical protein
LASFSTVTGEPMRSASASRNGSLRQAKCGENSTVARSLAIQPAAPMPTATTSCRFASSPTTAAMTRSVSWMSLLGVARRAVSIT